MKRIIVLLVMFAMLVNNNVFAISYNDNQTIERMAKEVAINHLNVLKTDFEIIKETPLYDFSDKQIGVWYHLKAKNGDSGYVIVSTVGDNLEVTEFSLHNDLSLVIEDKIYYNGLASYVIKEGKNYKDISTGNIIKSGYIAKPINEKSLKNKAVLTRTGVGVADTWLNHAMTPLNQHSASYDGDKKCAQTSAAMIVQYYKEHVAGYSSISNKTGGSLIDEVSNYIPLTNGVTTSNNLRTGLSEYITSKGFSNNVQLRTCDLNNDTLPADYIHTIASDISNNRPSIVIIGADAEFYRGEDILGDKTSSMHALTVTGTWSSGGVDYFDVIDPWDGLIKTIKWDPYNSESRQYFAVYACVRVLIN